MKLSGYAIVSGLRCCNSNRYSGVLREYPSSPNLSNEHVSQLIRMRSRISGMLWQPPLLSADDVGDVAETLVDNNAQFDVIGVCSDSVNQACGTLPALLPFAHIRLGTDLYLLGEWSLCQELQRTNLVSKENAARLLNWFCLLNSRSQIDNAISAYIDLADDVSLEILPADWRRRIDAVDIYLVSPWHSVSNCSVQS